MKKTTVKTNMKKTLMLLLPVYLGYLIYSVLHIFYGNCGVVAMRELEAYRETLVKNIAEIEENQEELALELFSLKRSVEKVALEARNIGFFRENEGIIEISGYEQPRNFYTLGRLLAPSKKAAFKKPLFRTISIGVIILSFIVLLLHKRRKNGRSHRKP